ncbi:MAG: hypothetical protein U5Q16_01520 [Gammaproteobacteria bacterium]|nr:hypothetical protein [Gammaproteobacteria bacterium]
MNLLLKLAALLAAGYVIASIALYLLQAQLSSTRSRRAPIRPVKTHAR